MAYRYQAIKIGGPFEKVLVDRPVPKEGEVLIRLHAIGLNPIDWKQLSIGIAVESWPATFGCEGSGTVEDVGPGVQGFKKGDEVFSRLDPQIPESAAFQELAIIGATSVTHKPKSLSFEEAASLTVGYRTGASAIYHALEIPLPFLKQGRTEGFTPKSILVLGGSSSVGAAAIQLLRIALPNAIILTTSSPQHHEHLKSLGANKAFDYHFPDVVQQIKVATPNGAGVEALIDPVASVLINSALLGTLTGPKSFAEVITGRTVQNIPADVKHTLVVGRNVMSCPGGENLSMALGELLESGRYNVPLPVTVVGEGLEAIEGGLATLKSGVSGTKLVVRL